MKFFLICGLFLCSIVSFGQSRIDTTLFESGAINKLVFSQAGIADSSLTYSESGILLTRRHNKTYEEWNFYETGELHSYKNATLGIQYYKNGYKMVEWDNANSITREYRKQDGSLKREIATIVKDGESSIIERTYDENGVLIDERKY